MSSRQLSWHLGLWPGHLLQASHPLCCALYTQGPGTQGGKQARRGEPAGSGSACRDSHRSRSKGQPGTSLFYQEPGEGEGRKSRNDQIISRQNRILGKNNNNDYFTCQRESFIICP